LLPREEERETIERTNDAFLANIHGLFMTQTRAASHVRAASSIFEGKGKNSLKREKMIMRADKMRNAILKYSFIKVLKY
jgi:hypothetical protein